MNIVLPFCLNLEIKKIHGIIKYSNNTLIIDYVVKNIFNSSKNKKISINIDNIHSIYLSQKWNKCYLVIQLNTLISIDNIFNSQGGKIKFEIEKNNIENAELLAINIQNEIINNNFILEVDGKL